MWINKAKADRTTICIECEAKDNLHACHVCKASKDRSHYSDSMWHHRHDQTAICIQCQAKEKTIACDICKVAKPRNAFSDSAIMNLAHTSQNSRCYDCSHPPCMFLPKCKTCANCRDHTCKKHAKCKKDIETLPSKQLPATLKECQTFACNSCKYVRCIVIQQDGTLCGKLRRNNAKKKARDNKEDYTCGECQTWLLSQRTMRENKP
jgi:hypothetical protein